MTEQVPAPLAFAETTVEALLEAATAKVPALASRPPEELERFTRTRVAELVKRNEYLVQDSPTAQWLQRTSIVLAVYEVLKPLTSSSEAIAILRDAMTAPFREKMTDYLDGRFGISQDAPAEAFARISENFKRRGEERFGKAFVYVQEVQDKDRTFTNIQRCFFNDFFRLNDAAEATSVFCALDSVWIESLHEPRYGVRFERPTTLARGADACRFQFSRSSSPAPENPESRR